MIDATPAGARRAALLLHALPAADRRWLLDRLDDGQRQRLQPLLGELDALGVQLEPADVSALMAAPVLPATDPAAGLADEPAWLREALGPGGLALAPAARRALRQAAARRQGRVEPAAVPPQGAGQARASWWQGVRQWLR